MLQTDHANDACARRTRSSRVGRLLSGAVRPQRREASAGEDLFTGLCEDFPMRTHLTVLGAVYMAVGCFWLVIAFIVFMSVAGGGLLSGDVKAIATTSGVAVILAVAFAILAAPAVVTGLALYRHRPWARLPGLILGCLVLPAIPFGTLLGIYTLWALTRAEAVEVLASSATS